MKAMLLTEYKHLEITDLPDPDFASDELLVEVRACGICGSDIHGWDGSTGRRVPPLVMGHEAAGIVKAAGSDVAGFQIGDRITFDSTVSCGVCNFCRAGKSNLCTSRQVLGVSCDEFRRNGAFAQFVVVPERICYRIPDEVPFEHAALIEAVSIAVHATNRAAPRLGNSALVVGAGMIGLLVVQTLKRAGCSTVIAVDLDQRKLDLAMKLGATHVIHPKSADVIEEVHRITGGLGAEISVEVVGAQPTVVAAIESTKRGGKVVLVGNLSPEVHIPLQKVVNRELDLLGSCASNGEYPECIELMRSGQIDVSPLITATATLEEGPGWFQRLYDGEPNAMKVVLCPNI